MKSILNVCRAFLSPFLSYVGTHQNRDQLIYFDLARELQQRAYELVRSYQTLFGTLLRRKIYVEVDRFGSTIPPLLSDKDREGAMTMKPSKRNYP